jgi:hypothetical protein
MNSLTHALLRSRRVRIPWLLPAALALAAGFSGCVMGPSEEQGGSGSEIVGKAEYPDSGSLCKNSGSAITRALPVPVVLGNVFCYTRSFVPDTAWASAGALPKAYSDSLGFFHLLDVPRGEVGAYAAFRKNQVLCERTGNALHRARYRGRCRHIARKNSHRYSPHH